MSHKYSNPEVWINSDNRLCFRSSSIKNYDLAIKLFFLFIIVLLIITICEYLIFKTSYSFLISFLILILLSGKLSDKLSDKLEKDEKQCILNIIKEQMDEYIDKYRHRYGDDVVEIKRTIYFKSKGTYGIIESTYVLILLSNDVVIEYPIIWNKELQCYELLPIPNECSDKERLLSINPHVIHIKEFKKLTKDFLILVKNRFSILFTLLVDLVLLSFVYIVIKFGLNLLLHIINIELKEETIVFIVLTLSAILSTYCRQFTKFLVTHSIFRDWGNHEYESKREKTLLQKTNHKNFTLSISLLYLIFLTISGYLQIQYAKPLISKEIDTSVLKAFLVFLAYSSFKKS